MNNFKLLETIADISYIAGYHQHYSRNSRFDITEYISWATEFEKINKNTDWDNDNYILAIEQFTDKKIRQSTVSFD